MDGWAIAQTSASTSYRTYFEAGTAKTDDEDAHVFYRPVGSPSTNTYYANRPLSRRETGPLRGKVVTLALDLKFGTGFPLGMEGHGLALKVCSTSSTSTTMFLSTSGQFSSENTVVEVFPEISEGSTTDYTRHSFTFTVPANSEMITLDFTHSPYGTGTSVATDYRYYIKHPTLALGTAPLPYTRRSWTEEYLANCPRFVRVRSTFCGSVTSGDVVYDHCQFPVPLEVTPVCLRATSEATATGFGTQATGDVTNLSTHGFTVKRTATSTTASAKWQAIYSFGTPICDFFNGIAS
jgi:hypothetical protein